MLKVYSLGCPKCIVLEMKLKQNSIKYERITDVDAVQNFGKEHKIYSLPLLEIIDEEDNKDSIVLNFTDAIRYINTLVEKGE